MKIELICTGSELLNGTINTNAGFIGSKLCSIGQELCLITEVSDKKEDLKKVFNSAISRSNIIIITGGLGPTFDDITVESVAECLNIPVYNDERVLENIKKYFLKRGKVFPEVNKKQANIIKSAKILENRFGTAPGQMLHFDFKDNDKSVRKTLFLLPGPPREMQGIFNDNVEPFLKSYSVGIRKCACIGVFGLAESEIEELIKPVIDGARFGYDSAVDFGILANDSFVKIKFSVSGRDEIFIDEIINKLKSGFSNILKDNIFGFEDDTLASVVGRLLIAKKKTISLAESCTGGKIASAITDIPGSSLYLKSAMVVYSNESKIKLLGVKEDTISNFGAVSEQTAKEMAEAVLRLSNTDYALSVTGIAGPGGAKKDKPVGLVYIGLSSKRRTEIFKFVFSGQREQIRRYAVNTSLDLLRRRLTKLGVLDRSSDRN
ncbi:MAG: competence/damage-inducible protein A [Endomicrobium sp.]|uniref:competence/damage-inducible protein A n=1 Tax=Candidatus Endomicrobiellum cubanum TaxID=3242325 RepID=UPI0028399A7D|nr:competence/damage-inducible protein A [Endomicrobium sp.]